MTMYRPLDWIEDDDDETPFYLRIPDPAADTEHDALTAVSAEELHGWLTAVAEPDASVLRWRHGLGGNEPLSIREVAARLEVAVSTAHSIERRGLRALRQAYGVLA
jgi:DNA-directed RNA polymerase sigma subunit (sigma70/sigma32)